MKSCTKRIPLSLALLSIVAAGIFAYAGGAAYRLAGKPTVVVTVNLQDVMEKLEQRAAAQASFSKIAAQVKAESEARKSKLTEMQDKLNSMTNQPDSKEKRDLQERFAQETLDFQAWANVEQMQLDIEISLSLQNLYQSIKEAARNMASAEGFDLVLVDDSRGELSMDPNSRTSRESQIRQQVAARRMLYANPEIDITNDLITRMNNAWKAGPGSGNAPAGGNGPANPAKPATPKP